MLQVRTRIVVPTRLAVVAYAVFVNDIFNVINNDDATVMRDNRSPRVSKTVRFTRLTV